MTAETTTNTSKTFKYSFPTCTNEQVLFNLEVPVEIPYNGSTRELVQRVINMFHIPVYLEEELNEKLAKFVADETKQYHNNRDANLINQLKNNDLNIDGIVKNWEKLFKENIVEYAELKGTSDEEVFGAAYHKLVHSPALEKILEVETGYATTVSDMLNKRDEDIKQLTQRQTEEMEEKIRLLNTFTTEQEINDLAASHFEEQSLAAGRWGSQLDALAQAQRAQYRAWLMATAAGLELDTPSTSPLGSFPPLPPRAPPAASPAPRLEDSATIHLGSQLKQTHNLRIVALDVAELCRVQGPVEPTSRLQTALGLYSTELSGVVLLADEGSWDATARRLAQPEYHFAPVDAQLNEIAERIKEPAEQRNQQRLKEQSTQTNGAGRRGARAGRRALAPGDVFVTKHSELAEVHVVFHLIKEEGRDNGDINSRHPAILGLRNILKLACCNDITSLSLPLLLTYELSDEMTAAWCARRGELVLKCVKGFMLEGASWGGAELRSIQFVLPAGLAPAVFQQLAALLPAIFRISNPLKFKATLSTDN